MTDTNTAQMVADLQANDSAINAQGWIAPGLGRPNSALGFLNADLNPLSGLAAAGLSWFMPLVSFLGDGLTQLQGGNGASVTSGSQDFGGAGQDLGGLAGSYRSAVDQETSGWTGAAADQYRTTGAQQASGIEGLGQGSTSTASAIIGAGQVVAQCIAEVTELIAEAVSQIVPIMTQAVARAGETNGESIAEAIPPCIAIAVEYALRIAAKLAALMASGDNLMKLVQGGMAIVDLLGTAMSSMSQQSVQPQLDSAPAAGGGQQGGDSTKAASAAQGADEMSDWNAAKPSASPAGGGSGGGGGAGSNVSSTPGVSNDQSVTRPDPGTTHSAGSISDIPAYHNSGTSGSNPVGHSGGGAGLGSRMPMGGIGIGAAERTAEPGSRTGVGTGSGGGSANRQSRQQSSGATRSNGGTMGGMPMGMGARPAGDSDKEHTNKYASEESHAEEFEVAPEVITNETFKN